MDQAESAVATLPGIEYELIQQVKLLYDISPQSRFRPYLIDGRAYQIVEDEKSGQRMLLRVSPDTCPKESIELELDWMNEIRNTTNLLVPEVIKGVNDQTVQTISLVDAQHRYYCVLFSYFFGPTLQESEDESVKKKYKRLGEVTAILHQSAILYDAPKVAPHLIRDFGYFLNSDAFARFMVDSPDIDAGTAQLLVKASNGVRSRLSQFGTNASRFGLINTHLELDNLMPVRSKISIRNFEGCGLGWYLYDFATSVQGIDRFEEISGLLAAWADGYRKHRKLSGHELSEAPTFIMLSRLIRLYKRYGSHFEKGREKYHDDLCRTARMAQEYLKK